MEKKNQELADNITSISPKNYTYTPDKTLLNKAQSKVLNNLKFDYMEIPKILLDFAYKNTRSMRLDIETNETIQNDLSSYNYQTILQLRRLNDLYCQQNRAKNKYNIDYIIEETKKSWKEFENLKSTINRKFKK